MSDLLGKIRMLGDKSPRHDALQADNNHGETQDADGKK